MECRAKREEKLRASAGKAKEVASANYPASACPEQIQERDWVFEKPRMMSSKI
jgi:hypothetical protein